jgi:two-component system, LytTR family, sensor kinase
MDGHIFILIQFYHIDTIVSIVDGFIYNFLLCAMGISFWYIVRFNTLNSDNFLTVLLNHAAACMISVSIWISVGYILLVRLFPDFNSYHSFLLNSLAMRFAIGTVFYTLISLAYYQIIYYKSLQEKLTREAELKTLVNKAELDGLKSQLNPHFIFNALNSISALTISNPDKAREMIIKLSTYLRYSLDQGSKHITSLDDEISNSLLYLDIEKIRFGNRMFFNVSIDDDARKAILPSMILQPLYENAIKHGVYESIKPVSISTKCSLNGNYLIVNIDNDFEEAPSASYKHGIGLRNIKDRLKLIYGRSDLIDIQTNEGVFQVSLFIPQKLNNI